MKNLYTWVAALLFVAFDRALRIKQDGNEFELDCDEADASNIKF